jgi:hypothetical protein
MKVLFNELPAGILQKVEKCILRNSKEWSRKDKILILVEK